jgi:hypothetical protein
MNENLKRKCTKDELHRIKTRIFLLLSIIAFTFIIILLSLKGFHKEKEFLLDSSLPLNITQQNCILYIKEDNSLPQDKLNMHIEGRGNIQSPIIIHL